ncbi:hypothetical protein CDL15_Pgr004347 [Punica granatum]|uniref:Uncharacterized protein n=1 Tax=Punica granatum TaxID=22663 RepID=A0A218XGR2_PUNGR|nr:hypothetical protein CDL15_Pgr004347 [Punica granatum]
MKPRGIRALAQKPKLGWSPIAAQKLELGREDRHREDEEIESGEEEMKESTEEETNSDEDLSSILMTSIVKKGSKKA